MKYIDAVKFVKNADFERHKSIKVFTSSEFNQLTLHLRAEAAIHKTDIAVEINSFGTLFQSLIEDKKQSDFEVLMLFPWDVFPELDWRTGGRDIISWTKNILDARFEQFSRILNTRPLELIVYCDAPFLPFTFNREDEKTVRQSIDAAVREKSHVILPPKVFSLKNYLKMGFPFHSDKLSLIAEKIVSPLLSFPKPSKKVIITDLDNTFWKGILGEEGVQNIDASPNGTGYIHFLYQKTLRKLKNSGVLLAIVSKNDVDLVNKAFSQREFELAITDFVSVFTSYDPKPVHIVELAKTLNLPLDSFVFIDDNKVEIAQVSKALPDVTCCRFPNNEEDFVHFLGDMLNYFEISDITTEDGNRTEMYKVREVFQKNISNSSTINIEDFLKTQSMKLACFNRSQSNFSRGLQLINKTNQFNMNGTRIDENKLLEVTSSGGVLLTGKLSDISGTHGEVIAILVGITGEVVSYVMSCRVFDRKLEFVFLLKVLEYLSKDLHFYFEKTERNTPFERFYSLISPCLHDNMINRKRFQKSYGHLRELIEDNGSFEI